MGKMQLVRILERNKKYDSNCEKLLLELIKNKNCTFYSKKNDTGYNQIDKVKFESENFYLVSINDKQNSETPTTLIKIKNNGVYFNSRYEKNVPLEFKEQLEQLLQAYQESQKSSS